MKFTKYSLLLLCTLFLGACAGGNNNETTSKIGEEAVLEQAAEEKKHQEREARGFHTFDPDFQTLTVSYDGIIRGVHMLGTKNDVKLSEQGQYEIDFDGKKSNMPRAALKEDTDNKLVYALKMTDKEDAVITYDFAEGKLNHINIRVNVPDNVSFEAMENELIQFFTHKFDTPDVIEGRKEVWKVDGAKVHEVDIIESQEGDKFYLEIEIK